MQTTPDLFARVPAVVPRFVAAASALAFDAIGEIEPGARIVGLSKGQISLIDLIEALLVQTGPADVAFSTWTLSDLSIQTCEMLMKSNRIRSLALVIDRSFPRCKPERARDLASRFGPSCFLVTRTHAKFALISNEKWHIAVRTSANLNRNPRFEQFDVDDSPEIWGFFSSHVEELRSKQPHWDQGTGRTFAQFEELLGGGISTAYPVPTEPDDLGAIAARWRKRI